MDKATIDPRHTRHGGAYDRGSADSWYQRPRRPHFFVGATGQSKEVTAASMSMTPEEIAAYNQGYDDNEAEGGHKEWGEE